MEPRAPPQHHHQHHQPPHQHHHQPPQGMMLQQHHHHQHHQQQQQQHQQHQQHQHHQLQHHHQHHPTNTSYPSQNMPNSSSNPPQMIATPNSSSPSMLQNNRFPFTSQVVSNTPPSKTAIEPLNSPYSGDGSSGLRQSGFGIDPNSTSSQKKKRGRPRKYSPDGGGSNIALGLAPTPIASVGVGSGAIVAASGGGGGGGQADSTGTAPSSENPSKRHRGRPPGSSKKQLDALGNCGVGFTPHVILVNAGEDIASKIVAFSKQGPRTVCVLSANGSICNVSLRQPALTGGVVNYEGRYEIISLSGSFLFSESSGGLRTGGLSVSLAGSDGRVLGGGVAGRLMAATPVQIIVGSFIANGKKTKYMPSVPQSHVLNFAAAPPLPTAESPPSQEDSSEESEDNGSNHIERTMGSYGNSNHPMHNMQMYNPMGWPNSAPKMLQN